MWKEISSEYYLTFGVATIAALFFSVLAMILFVNRQKGKTHFDFMPVDPVFLIFSALVLINTTPELSTIITNLLLLITGTLTIRKGAINNHLGVLNYGLLIISAQVACRFFDTNLSFVIRGGLFLIVGISFFVINYLMLKKRKEHEENN
jgi:hypothetical protein